MKITRIKEKNRLHTFKDSTVRELFFDLFTNSFNKVFELILENEDRMR